MRMTDLSKKKNKIQKFAADTYENFSNQVFVLGVIQYQYKRELDDKKLATAEKNSGKIINKIKTPTIGLIVNEI